MRSFRYLPIGVLGLATLLAAVGCGSEPSIGLEPAEQRLSDLETDRFALAAVPAVHFKEACAPTKPGTRRCHALVVTDENGEEIVNHEAQGLSPTDLRAAYKLPTSGGSGRLVAIVDGYDAPNAEADMNTYRAQFGIPPCTTASGCFKKVNGDGLDSPLPAQDPGWITEIAVDLDMVSAMCPDCKILLVEAKSGLAIDLGPAVKTAARLGAFAINNSYGEPEDDAAMARLVEQDYNQPGVLVVASSGDNGYGRSTSDDGMLVQQNANPANLPWVMSVGGTRLAKSTTLARGWTETTWTGAGSGCSSHMPKPAWQKDTGCPRRTIADVSAVADPATGVAYYNGRWSVVGGTSISSPIVTGIFALFGINSPSWPYEHPGSFYDVTSGTNGSCGGTYQCTAGVGYDGPTGLGTPNGALFNAPPAMDGGSPPADGGGGGGTGGRGAGGGAGTGVGTGGGGSAATGAGGTAGATGVTGAGGASGSSVGSTGAGGQTTGVGGSTDTTGSTTGAGGNTSTTSGTTGSAGSSSTGPTGSTSTSSTGSSAVTGTSGAGGSNGSTTGDLPKPDAGGGCSCRIGEAGPASSQNLAGWVLFGMGLVGARRRRR